MDGGIDPCVQIGSLTAPSGVHTGAESSHNRKLDKAGPQPRTGGTTLGAKQVRLATGAQVLQSGGGQCFMGPISLAAGSRCVCALLETL